MRRRTPSRWVAAGAVVLSIGLAPLAEAVGAGGPEATPMLVSAPTLTAVRAASLSCAGSSFLPPGPADGWATPVFWWAWMAPMRE